MEPRRDKGAGRYVLTMLQTLSRILAYFVLLGTADFIHCSSAGFGGERRAPVVGLSFDVHSPLFRSAPYGLRPTCASSTKVSILAESLNYSHARAQPSCVLLYQPRHERPCFNVAAQAS